MAEQAPLTADGKSPARVGRKFGPVRARSQEYEALAHFLRQRVQEAGLTLGELEAATGLKKSAIGERLAGLKLDAEFVEAVVLACTETTVLLPGRARLRKEGAQLLEIAKTHTTQVLDLTRQPTAVRNVAVAAQDVALKAQAKLLDLHEQLDRRNDELAALTRVQQQSQLALRDTDALSSVLSTWVIVLADEVEQLTQERRLAMTARPPDLKQLSGLDAELARTTARKGRTATELARAQEDGRLARALLTEALTRTRRVREEIRRLRDAAQLPPGGEAASGKPAAEDLYGFASPSGFGADADAALDRAEVIGRTIADRLHTALTALDEEAETLPLSAASPASPASATRGTDNADNGLTSAFTTDNALPEETLWWDLLANVPTDPFVWAEETAAALAGDRNPHDPLFEHLARERPAREILLLADRLQEHRWLEGTARMRIALALSLPPEELVRLVLALTEAGAFLNRVELGAQLLRAALAGRTVEDTLALHNEISTSADSPPIMRKGVAAIAQRPYADVVALVRKQLMDNPRLLTHGTLMEAIVRKWPPGEVASLVEEVLDIEGGYIVGHVFFALPDRRPSADETELLVRMWGVAPSHGFFHEMLPARYPGDASSKDLAKVIATLHASWPSPLDRAARELAEQVMPLIIRGRPAWSLDHISDRLARSGLSPEEIFEPYKDLLAPKIARAYAGSAEAD